MVKDIRDYILNKLFFPKVAVIDRPGILINKTIGRFGKEGVKTRYMYVFEDIYSDLHLETQREQGKEKTNHLWYKIGKDVATRYFLFSKRKKIPNTLTHLVIKHIFKTFSSAGITFAKSVKFNIKEKSLITNGINCVICRKTKISGLVEGMTSGILSSLFNENIEAESQCENCPKGCKIVANPSIKEKYRQIPQELKIDKNYAKLNFFEDYNSFNYSPKFKSLADLLKFKKIWLSEEEVFKFQDKTIIPSEIGLSEIALKNYFDVGLEKLFKKTIIKSSEEIMADILINEDTLKNKINTLNMIITAFGWGIPHHKKVSNKIIFELINPPITKYGNKFITFILNGFLNKIYHKNFKIEKRTDYKIEFVS